MFLPSFLMRHLLLLDKFCCKTSHNDFCNTRNISIKNLRFKTHCERVCLQTQTHILFFEKIVQKKSAYIFQNKLFD